MGSARGGALYAAAPSELPRGAPVSVDECRAVFDGVAPYTIGIEEEVLLLLVPGTTDVAPAIESVLRQAGARLHRRH